MSYLLFPARSLSYPCVEGKILSCWPEGGGGGGGVIDERRKKDELKVHKREKFFVSDFEFFTIL
jgi:hypothetical protein